MPWISYRIKTGGVRRQVVHFSILSSRTLVREASRKTARREDFSLRCINPSFLMLFARALGKSSSSEAKNLTNAESCVAWGPGKT